MRIGITIAFNAVLLICVVTVATAQAQNAHPTTAPDTTSIVPLKVGGDVTAPRPINTPDPEYSEDARRAKHNGTCVLTVTVGADGKTSNISILHSAGMGLDEKAIETVRTWTFEPARKEGKPIPVQIQVDVTFKIGNLKIEHEAKLQAEFKKRMQALIYRVPDNDVPKTCPIPSSENQKKYDPRSIQIDARSKYQLQQISFLNYKAIGNPETLRSRFPIKIGDMYDSDSIAKGLNDLRHAYAGLGYIDFVAVPHISTNDVNHTVALEVFLNEGRQFFVSRIDIIGLDEPAFQKIKTQLMLEPGQPFNQRLMEVFLEKRSKELLKHLAITPSFSLQRNEQDATVAITYDFRQCSAN